MKALLVPGMLFEELGFAYIGVVDGHDMHALRESIRQAIDTRRPVVVHVKTVKGKGYEPAEARPDAYPRHRARSTSATASARRRRCGHDATPRPSARRWCASPSATSASSPSPRP